MKLNELNIKQARQQLDTGQISALELTKDCLAQIKQENPVINAVITVCEDLALEQAKAADQRLAAGERGGLLGIPYLCKDNLMTKGVKTTAGSKMLANYLAPYDATVVKKLKEAGAILLGKTNLDEFAHGASTESSAFGPTKNPHDLSRVPGGSSGGSAAAVAAKMCLFALASDTGGSVRQPASFCGQYGLKPSYGRISRFGLLSMTSSTDTVAILAKSAYDSALVLKTIAGVDRLDASSSPEMVKHYEAKLESGQEQSLAGLKVGLPREYFSQDLDPLVAERVRAVASKLEALGATLQEVSLPHTEYGVAIYYIITPAEISSNLARFDGVAWGLAHPEVENLKDFYRKNRGQGFGSEVKRRLMIGTYALSAGYYDEYYKKAQTARTLIIRDFEEAFKSVDLLLTPTTPHPAFKLGEQVNDPLAMYLEDIFVTGASLAGLPAISIPAGELVSQAGTSLPIGAQLIAPPWQEEELLLVADLLK
ncbi:MAG: Asp-tRNA(Asn)/Glu-tRNA(Gln) amidotransferase subunit GatA [Patescibacteria group bacterium]|jgi:aspartyl-tRNA(Asn)/glutamyl-tRNA(Gln) amidotransferase subunit A